MKLQRKYHFLLFSLVILCVSILYIDYFSYMFRLWLEVPKRDVNKFFIHNHAVIIFPLCFSKILIDSILSTDRNGRFLSVFLFVSSLLLLIIGHFSSVYYISNIAFVCSILSCIGYFYGYGGILKNKICLFLLFYLVPLPQFLLIQIFTKASLFVSLISTKIIMALGWPIYFDGNTVDLGSMRINNIDINSCLSIVPAYLGFVAFLMIFFNKGKSFRLFFFLGNFSVICFSVILKFVLIVYFSKQSGSSYLLSSNAINYFVLIVLSLTNIAYVFFLSAKDGVALYFSNLLSKIKVAQDDDLMTINYDFFFLVFSGILCLFFLKNYNEGFVPNRKKFVDFPVVVGDWHGVESYVDKKDLASLHLTDFLSRSYVAKNQSQIDLWIAYYGSQKPGASIHSPKACLPGGGWEMTSTGRVVIESENFTFERAIIKIGEQRQLVYFAYIVGDIAVTNEYLVKFFVIANKLMHNRSDGALIRLITQVSREEDIEKEDQKMMLFLAAFIPIVKAYVSEDGE